jgi:S1-C subfamily serine protease
MEHIMQKKVKLSIAAIVIPLIMMACSVTSLIPTATPVAIPAVPTLALAGATTDTTAQQSIFESIYQQANLGVVTIQTTTGLGSGWVYSTDGYIVTNAHVVDTATQVEVDFPSGLKTYGNVVAADAYSDLAVVKVNVAASELHPLPMGDSNALQVGQTVVAIGNPFGLSDTMTTGIISALGRALPSNSTTQASTGGYYSTPDIIQTDAAINPGNSGGPLLNLNGEVIGINSDIIPSSSTTVNGQGGNIGIGFAISINLVKRVVPSLIQNGKFDYAYLGISAIDNLPLDVIQALGLQSTSGAYVVNVFAGGPSEQAGLVAGTTPLTLAGYTDLNKGGDLIVAIDGQPVITFYDMIRYLALYKSPGDTVTLTVMRGSQKVDLPLVLGTRPSN